MVKYSVRYHNLLLSHVTFGMGGRGSGPQKKKKVTSRISTRGWGSTSMELAV